MDYNNKSLSFFLFSFSKKISVSLSISSILLPLYYILLTFMTSPIATNSALIYCHSINNLLSICLFNFQSASSIYFISNLSFPIIYILCSTIHVVIIFAIYRNNIPTLLIIIRHLPFKIPKARFIHMRVEL